MCIVLGCLATILTCFMSMVVWDYGRIGANRRFFRWEVTTKRVRVSGVVSWPNLVFVGFWAVRYDPDFCSMIWRDDQKVDCITGSDCRSCQRELAWE